MPSATLFKYDELKGKILSESQMESPSNEHLSSQLKDEMISIQGTFINIITEFMSCVVIDGSADKHYQRYIGTFFENFEQKRKDIHEFALESFSTPELRLHLKEHLQTLDDMERSFEKTASTIEGLGELLGHKNQVENAQSKKIQKLEDEIENAVTEIKNNSAAVKENELLRIEKQELLNKIGTLETEISDLNVTISAVKKDGQEQIEALEEVQEGLAGRLAEFEEISENFINHFLKFSELYEGPSENATFQEMVEFACEFAEKVEGDNRWLLTKVSDCEEIIGKMRVNSQEQDQKNSNKDRTMGQFLEELTCLTQHNEERFNLIEGVASEFEEYLREGVVRVKNPLIPGL